MAAYIGRKECIVLHFLAYMPRCMYLATLATEEEKALLLLCLQTQRFDSLDALDTSKGSGSFGA